MNAHLSRQNCKIASTNLSEIIPRRAAVLKWLLRSAVVQFSGDVGNSIPVRSLGTVIDASEEKTNEGFLYAPVGTGDEEKSATEIPVEFDDETISTKISIFQILDKFETRDKNLIYLRFFKGITQSETAANLGMTQVQVSRREKVLLRTLRENLA